MSKKNVRIEGNGYYTDDAEYVVGDTASGYKVTRGDGSYAEFLDSEDAHEAAERLASGDAEHSDFLWHE